MAVAVAAALIVGASSAAAQSPCRHVAVRSPFAGDTLAGNVPILGSAQIDGFLFYKLEYAPASEPESWRAVSTTINNTARHGLLDTWNTAAVPDGSYRLKLTMVDQQSQEPCRVIVNNLTVANGPGPTPSATATAPAVTVRAGARGTAPPPADDSSASAPPAVGEQAGSDASPESLPTVDALGDNEGAGDVEDSDAVGDDGVSADGDGGDAGGDASGDAADAGGDEGDVGSDAGEGDAEPAADEGDADSGAETGSETGSDTEVASDAPDQIALGGLAEANEPADADGESSFADRPEEPESADLFPQPSTLADSVGVASWPVAFCGGMVAMVLLMVFVAAVLALRRSS